MLQTGTLYTLVNDKNSIVKKEPIENVYITFSQNGKSVLTVKTDNAGKFSFNLPIGSYQVTVSQGAGFRVFDLAGGAPFELTKDSKQNAFEEWVLSPIYLKPESNPLVLLLQDMIQNIQIEATEAIVDIEKIKKDAVLSLNQKAGQVSKDATKAVNDINAVKTSAINNINSLKTSAIKDLNNIANQAKTSASNAKTSENAAKKTANDFNKKLGFGNHLSPLTWMNTPADWSKPSGWVGFLHTSSKGMPTGAGYTMAQCMAKRDVSGGSAWMLFSYARNRAYFAARGDDKDFLVWREIYSTGNTTIDSNGHLKAASPIIRLFDDRIEHNGQFTEEPQFRKIDTGIYQVFNTLGLAKEGWTIETPEDENGNPYFHVVVQKTYDGAIISVHDEYDVRRKKKIKDIFGEEQEVEVVEKILGEARDIKPHERWIDLRFHEKVEDEFLIGTEE